MVNREVEHSNTPTLQHSNTPTLQHSNTPTLQHSNTPTLQHSNTPTLQHSNIQHHGPTTILPRKKPAPYQRLPDWLSHFADAHSGCTDRQSRSRAAGAPGA